MFNLFEGGIKGRLFNNPAEGGEKVPQECGTRRRVMKKGIVSVVALLGALVLVGWGCGNGYSVSNWEPDTGGQPQTYESSEWGVNFTYPGGWQYREYRETVEGEEIVTLAFSDQELPETMPPEPLFPIMVTRDSRTVDEVTAVHADAISDEDATFGGRSAKVITRYSDILETNYRIYVVPLRGGSIQFVPLDASYVSIAENMITNLTETE